MLYLKDGDPYGNRTRASAVNPRLSIKTTPLGPVPDLIDCNVVNELKGRGHASPTVAAVYVQRGGAT